MAFYEWQKRVIRFDTLCGFQFHVSYHNFVHVAYFVPNVWFTFNLSNIFLIWPKACFLFSPLWTSPNSRREWATCIFSCPSFFPSFIYESINKVCWWICVLYLTHLLFIRKNAPQIRTSDRIKRIKVSYF